MLWEESKLGIVHLWSIAIAPHQLHPARYMSAGEFGSRDPCYTTGGLRYIHYCFADLTNLVLEIDMMTD